MVNDAYLGLSCFSSNGGNFCVFCFLTEVCVAEGQNFE